MILRDSLNLEYFFLFFVKPQYSELDFRLNIGSTTRYTLTVLSFLCPYSWLNANCFCCFESLSYHNEKFIFEHKRDVTLPLQYRHCVFREKAE